MKKQIIIIFSIILLIGSILTGCQTQDTKDPNESPDSKDTPLQDNQQNNAEEPENMQPPAFPEG